MAIYKGTIDLDNVAGCISARVFPAYLKAEKEQDDGYPEKIACGAELFTEMVKLMEERQYGVKEVRLPKDEMFGMKVIYDDSLNDDEWELRWGE